MLERSRQNMGETAGLALVSGHEGLIHAATELSI